MNCPENITFSNFNFISTKINDFNNEEMLNTNLPVVAVRKYKMSVKDAITGDLFITFTVDAELALNKEKEKLQRLKLETDTPNTYILSLRFNEGKEDIYALSGRYTSYKRDLARKLLLTGLSNADYNTGIEKARQDTLYSFSSYISTALFEPNVFRIQQNILPVNLWLTRLLG